jgi:FkbM family methyltransferase
MELDLTRKNQKQIFWFYEDIESSLQWTIAELLPKGGRMVDCGANAGIMGFLALTVRNANVEFFEPMPRLAKTIRKNLQLNGLEEKATVHELAASNEEGETPFHVHLRDGNHSLVNSEGAIDSLTVQTRKLSTLLDFANPIDLLKVDTEGNDYQVLTGIGEKLNPSNIKRIYCEMGGQQERSHRLLLERGYNAYRATNPKRSIPFERRKGKVSPCYYQIASEPTLNCLWVGKDSPEEKELLRKLQIKT